MSGESTTSLARRITEVGYRALFKASGHEHLLGEIWKSVPQRDFESLAADIEAPSQARFVASQILLSKDITFWSRADLNSLSSVYIQAMLGNYTKSMSDWGFLRRNDDMGILGSAFLVFGERAVRQLVSLLNDGTVVGYERTPPDVSGFDFNRLQKIRVKDFAALYLSKIRDVPLELKVGFEQRDEEITNLRNKL